MMHSGLDKISVYSAKGRADYQLKALNEVTAALWSELLPLTEPLLDKGKKGQPGPSLGHDDYGVRTRHRVEEG